MIGLRTVIVKGSPRYHNSWLTTFHNPSPAQNEPGR